MSKFASTTLLGLAAGASGTVVMAGTSFIMRRMIEPDQPISKTHYEAVVEWVAGKGDGTPNMEVEQRIRIGEMTHLGFGALWGALFALRYRNKDINPLALGAVYGTALWAGAFGGYMPALGITKSIAEMDTYERSRTLLCHFMYATGTFTFLKAFRRE